VAAAFETLFTGNNGFALVSALPLLMLVGTIWGRGGGGFSAACVVFGDGRFGGLIGLTTLPSKDII